MSFYLIKPLPPTEGHPAYNTWYHLKNREEVTLSVEFKSYHHFYTWWLKQTIPESAMLVALPLGTTHYSEKNCVYLPKALAHLALKDLSKHFRNISGFWTFRIPYLGETHPLGYYQNQSHLLDAVNAFKSKHLQEYGQTHLDNERLKMLLAPFEYTNPPVVKESHSLTKGFNDLRAKKLAAYTNKTRAVTRMTPEYLLWIRCLTKGKKEGLPISDTINYLSTFLPFIARLREEYCKTDLFGNAFELAIDPFATGTISEKTVVYLPNRMVCLLKPDKVSPSGLPRGVTRPRVDSKLVACISDINGKLKQLGTFKSSDEAYAAYVKAKKAIFDELVKYYADELAPNVLKASQLFLAS